ncbi:MAG: porin [Proteobacteria bacterium]|nr:porin [Pseudomonadota bacterium]
MKKQFKTIALGVGLVLSNSPALAFADAGKTGDLTVRLGGSLTTQIGAVSQKSAFKHVDPTDPTSSKLRNFPVIVNDTKIIIGADAKLDKISYGMEITHHADASASKSGNSNPSKNTWAYVETRYGRLEGGSGTPSHEKLGVGAHTIAKATGGIDGDMLYWVNQQTGDGEYFSDNFLVSPYLPIGHDWSARANKLTYYTPTVAGLKIGVSYIPESKLIGTISALNSDVIHDGDGSYYDVVDAVAQYAYGYGDFKLTYSVTGQAGKAKYDGGINRHRLRAWEAGIMTEYKGFALAGSYGDWGKSGTINPSQAGYTYGSHYWTAGTSYDYKDTGISLTYFRSYRAGGLDGSYNEVAHNKLRVLSLGLEQKVAPGLLAYVESSYFEMKRVNVSNNNNGVVTLAGLKVKW